MNMQNLAAWGLLVTLLRTFRVQAHGTTLSPWGRATGNYYCPWCVGEHLSSNPYNTINHDATPSTPCLGSSRNGSSFGSDSFNGHSQHLAAPPEPSYTLGQTFQTWLLLNADHAGDAAWFLCPHSEAETEECFRERQITPWTDVHAHWGGDSSIDHWKDNQPFPQMVTLPTDMERGWYTLRWLWVCKFTDEVFVSCVDIAVGEPAGPTPEVTYMPTPSVTTGPTPAPTPSPTTGTCTPQWNDCRSSKCCQSAADSCFEKDQWYAQCRPSCPGDWPSCAILTPDGTVTPTPTASPMPAPTPYPTATPTSYYPSANPTAAPSPSPSPTLEPTSSPTPAPGPLPTAAPSPLPTAAPTGLPTAAPSAAPTGSTSCSGKWQNCQKTMCCRSASDTCYEQNEWYAQCRPSCPTGGWSCVQLGGGGSSPAPAPGCANLWQQCGGKHWNGATTCCDGATCHPWDADYHQCRPAGRLVEVKRHSSFLSASEQAANSPVLVQKAHDVCPGAARTKEEQQGLDAVEDRAEL